MAKGKTYLNYRAERIDSGKWVTVRVRVVPCRLRAAPGRSGPGGAVPRSDRDRNVTGERVGGYLGKARVITFYDYV